MATSLKMRTLSFLSDKNDKRDEKTHSSYDASLPPPYQADDPAEFSLSASIRKLHLGVNSASVNNTTIPTNDECIAHLKLLTSFAHLREEISETDGLFGVNDALAEGRPSLLYATSEQIIQKTA